MSSHEETLTARFEMGEGMGERDGDGVAFGCG